MERFIRTCLTQNTETETWGRFHSRQSDSFCRSNWFLPEMTRDHKTCFRVGHFRGQMHFSRKKCDGILELKCIFINEKWVRNDHQNCWSFSGHSELSVALKINLTKGCIWPMTMKPPSGCRITEHMGPLFHHPSTKTVKKIKSSHDSKPTYEQVLMEFDHL